MNHREFGSGRPSRVTGSVRNDVDAKIANIATKNQSRWRSRSGIGTVEKVFWSALSGNASAVFDMHHHVPKTFGRVLTAGTTNHGRAQGELAQQRARHHHALNLVSALVDLGDLGV